MNIKGQKIFFLGDSITEGGNASCEENIYLNYMKKNYELGCAKNYGIGGTRIARQYNPSIDVNWDKSFISRVDEMDMNPDVIVVFGGTNDYGHGDAPLGTFSDRTDDTFYGACHVLYEKLITKYPYSTIVVMTPLHRLNEDNKRGEGFKEKEVGTLSDYVAIIKEVAEYYALPVLDLFSISGLQPNLPIIKEKYCPDGLHPNDAGHALIAERLAYFLLSL